MYNGTRLPSTGCSNVLQYSLPIDNTTNSSPLELPYDIYIRVRSRSFRILAQYKHLLL